MVVSKRLVVESNLQDEVTGLPRKFQRVYIHIVLDIKKKWKPTHKLFARSLCFLAFQTS